MKKSFKKTTLTAYSLILLIVGAFMQSNCSDKATADTAVPAGSTVAASTIIFDNQGTGLTATNLQDAITELENTYGSFNVAKDILGTWTGSYESLISPTNTSAPANAAASGLVALTAGIQTGTVSLTLNSDGTFTCSFSPTISASGIVCNNPATSFNFSIFGRRSLKVSGTIPTNSNRVLQDRVLQEWPIALLTTKSLQMTVPSPGAAGTIFLTLTK